MGIELLIVELKTVPDWRRGGRAVQYPLWLMLLTTLLGVMSGYSSLRGLADFMARHQGEVGTYFGLSKANSPSYSTLRKMAQHVDGPAVAQAFQQWAQVTAPVAAGAAVAVDGKALGSTVQDCFGSQQDFVMVVSACVQSWAGVMGQVSFQNGKTSEIVAVRTLLEQLNLKGVWFTLDALHCQKNASANCRESKPGLYWVESQSGQLTQTSEAGHPRGDAVESNAIH
jgi:DDE_Tnp_1-associated